MEIEWLLSLLPMYRLGIGWWRPGQPVDPERGPLVTQYAHLFVDGAITKAYTRTCQREGEVGPRFLRGRRGKEPRDRLLVLRKGRELAIVYFHNTSAFGVLLKGPGAADPVIEAVSRASAVLAYEYDAFSGAFRERCAPLRVRNGEVLPRHGRGSPLLDRSRGRTRVYAGYHRRKMRLPPFARAWLRNVSSACSRSRRRAPYGGRWGSSPRSSTPRASPSRR